MSSQLLQDKVVLVTGATRGIGSGIAVALGREGAVVIGTSTTEAGAERITQSFQANQINGYGMVVNIASRDSTEALISTIKERSGPVNVLINNAAIAQDNLFLRMKEDEWLKVIETDLSSVFRLSKACMRDMLKARWGRIISIGSVVGSTGNPGQVNYCAAKAGLIGFTKALALEVGSRNITANVVSPGYVVTDMTSALTDEQRESILGRIPMQKPGTVEDIAAAVLFLASPQAGYITGQTIHVNGGMYMN